MQNLALRKARDVASRTRRGIVVGSDTLVVLGRFVLGKPSSSKDARRMLRRLSGRSHMVYTGVAIVDAVSGASRVFYERTKVTFRKISGREIAAYVRSGSPLDKAGAYGIQDDFGAVFVEKVSGCFYTVVGFPLSRFYTELERFRRRLSSKTTRRR